MIKSFPCMLTPLLNKRPPLGSRGVSGLNKTDETEKISDLVWFGSKPIQTNKNRYSLVRFSDFNFEEPINETDTNLTLHFSDIILPHIHIHTLVIKLKIKVQLKILLNSFTFSHHHLIST